MSRLITDLYFLPPAAYFAKVRQNTEILLDFDKVYRKGTYANKCHILAANGPMLLTVPLRHDNLTKSPIRDTKLAYDMDWPRHHWQSILSAYGSAPYFPYFSDKLKDIYQKKHAFLIDLNLELLSFICACLKIDAVFKDFGGSTQGDQEDWRGQLSPKEPILGGVKPYIQVFQDRFGFVDGMSVLDLIFCEGPYGRDRLK